jgi:hypothetical protein
MNLGKLGKRLRKELLANPKQAAVLAIACLVACWFWSPLLMKWFKGKGKAQAAKVEPATAVVTIAAKVEPQRPWFDIQRWRLADPLTRSAAQVDAGMDPFRVPTPVAANQSEDEEEQTAQTKVAPLQQVKLNLTLEAILYSGSRRLAQINGQTLRENEEFAISGQGAEPNTQEEADSSSQIMGRVTAIHPSEVFIEAGGQSLRLSLSPKLLGRGEVVKRLPRQ